ncbi:MAG: hypothetical protein IJ573_11145 [Clostridia bacterium]|nr:hypothetical protein [Clostridia bacterium]
MDKRERIAAAIAGEATDRVSCGFWHHFDKKDAFGVASVRAHLDFYEATDADVLKVMNEHMYRLEQEIRCAEDWRKVRPVPFERTDYPDYIEEFRAIRRAVPRDVPLWVTIHGALVSAYHATDTPGHFSNPDNRVSRHLREEPESVAPALMAVAETLADLCDRLIDAGADGVYYAALGGESYRFSQQLLEEFVIPADRYVISRVKARGATAVLHICKDKVMLPAYRSIDADVFNWAVHECPYSLKDGRSLFPGKTLLGGFDDRSGVLVDGTEEEIAAETHAILREAGTSRFILGADCTLPDDVDLGRVRAAKKAVLSFK